MRTNEERFREVDDGLRTAATRWGSCVLAGLVVVAMSPSPFSDPRSPAGVSRAQSTCPTEPYGMGDDSGPAETYKIEGCVWHFGGCSVEDGVMHLSPLDLSTQVEVSWFCFDGIPPGEYSLSYSPQCNPAGCTGVTNVTVIDEDIDVVIGRSDCPGDCTADYEVTVDEAVACVRQALGEGGGCGLCNPDHDRATTISDLVEVVRALLHGC